MPSASTPDALLRRWLAGIVSPEDRQRTCAVLCMDYRYGGRFAGCYQVENAGPRCEDSARSIEYLVQLTPDDAPLILFWLTHDGLCGCSRVETGSGDPEVVEPHTADTRRRELRRLLAADGAAAPRFRQAVADGRALLIAGHVDVAVQPPTARLLVDESNGILRDCGLPELPEAFSDVNLPVG